MFVYNTYILHNISYFDAILSFVGKKITARQQRLKMWAEKKEQFIYITRILYIRYKYTYNIEYCTYILECR